MSMESMDRDVHIQLKRKRLFWHKICALKITTQKTQIWMKSYWTFLKHFIFKTYNKIHLNMLLTCYCRLNFFPSFNLVQEAHIWKRHFAFHFSYRF